MFTKDTNKWKQDRKRILDESVGAVVVWDFDGVIADTEPLHEESYRLMLKRVGYKPTRDFYPPYTGKTDEFMWHAFKDLGVKLDNDVQGFAKEKSDTLKQVIKDKVSLKPTWLVKDLYLPLSDIAKRQVILSNGDIEIIISLLKRWGLITYLEVIQKPNENRKKELLLDFLSEGKTVIFEDNGKH